MLCNDGKSGRKTRTEPGAEKTQLQAMSGETMTEVAIHGGLRFDLDRLALGGRQNFTEPTTT